MNAFDYAVLFGSILAIAIYGIFRTRGRRNLHDYLRGKKQSWFVIGLSVMATQASAITFLSTPGQGYADGMTFIQNYFAVPLALVIIAAFFLPLFRKLNVYTAYEYLGNRFDTKTRLLAAALFLFQRGMGAGITIYAPAIVLSTVFGWSLPLTIIASGIVATAYTVAGGSDAVTHTQKYQIAVIFAGMIAAFCILLSKIPCSFPDALTLAGHFGKLNAVDFSLDPKKRYTLWTGMFGGIFLMLSYFGTDQSQVQRYISGDNLRQSRLGLMFNALFKIPMQFGILLLGVMLFVFYLFHSAPLFFNQTALNEHLNSSKPATWTPEVRGSGVIQPSEERLILGSMSRNYSDAQSRTQETLEAWNTARKVGDESKERDALNTLTSYLDVQRVSREETKLFLKQMDPSLNTNDNDYVFITFILDNLPHGLIGLLVASFFLAALSSKAAELNALASCSVIDFYRLLRPKRSPPFSTARADSPSTPEITPASSQNASHSASTDKSRDSLDTSDRHFVIATKLFTLLWGLTAIAFALFVTLVENLIQASNIIGSLFSGVVLGLFLIAFFIKFIRGTAAFYGAIVGQSLVLLLWAATFFFPSFDIAYLWYNLIGCAACIFVATLLQLILGPPPRQGFPIEITPQPTI